MSRTFLTSPAVRVIRRGAAQANLNQQGASAFPPSSFSLPVVRIICTTAAAVGGCRIFVAAPAVEITLLFV